jgi:hypothetical protein
MRGFRGPVDGEGSEGSESDEFDEIQPVFFPGPLDIVPDDEDGEEEGGVNPGVIMFHIPGGEDGPIIIVPNPNDNEDYEPDSSESEDEPLEFDSAEEDEEDEESDSVGVEDEDEEVSEVEVVEAGEGDGDGRSRSPVPATAQGPEGTFSEPPMILPYADISDSDDLSSLGTLVLTSIFLISVLPYITLSKLIFISKTEMLTFFR